MRKGDKVKVIAGKDKGREGTIETVYKNSARVVVPGINIYKKHIKKNDQMPQGGVVELPRPLDVSKVMVVCPKCNKPTRLGFDITKAGKKVRVCKNCDSKI